MKRESSYPAEHATSGPPTTNGDLMQQISSLGPWFQNLHLPGGFQTAPDHPLGDFPTFKWEQIKTYLPQDLSGWTALDIGCNAGFYCVELARRNAHVLGIDREPLYLAQANWAAQLFGFSDRIEFRQMQVYELARLSERFDLVLFMGIFYHLRYPLLALDGLSRLVNRLMIFQSLMMPGEEVYANAGRPTGASLVDVEDRQALLDPGWPKMAFFENGFAGDRTNWWAPNHACVLSLLRSCGFRVLARPGHEIYLCEPDPGNRSCAATWNREEYLAASGLWRSRSAKNGSSELSPPETKE